MNYALSADLLHIRQSLPLDIKTIMTRNRIRNYVTEYGLDGVYISFSGGKDSTVLLDIARKEYPDIQAVFLDTWLEYPEVRKFAAGFDHLVKLKPVMGMKDIISTYGWCFPSKDVAEAIWAARRGQPWAIRKLHGLDKEGKPCQYRQQYIKWLPLLESDIPISHMCCDKQKEEPIARYERQTGRHPILGLLAEESARRKEAYLRTGCNNYDSNRPVSKPISFWTEQDIFQYKVTNQIAFAPTYGEIVEADVIPGQMSLFPLSECSSKLTCTGERRTGCAFCPVGCHLDGFAKFKRLKLAYPRFYDFCMEELGEKRLLEWIGKHWNIAA